MWGLDVLGGMKVTKPLVYMWLVKVWKIKGDQTALIKLTFFSQLAYK